MPHMNSLAPTMWSAVLYTDSHDITDDNNADNDWSHSPITLAELAIGHIPKNKYGCYMQTNNLMTNK